jgi:uncharacterized protein YndB with AHSA1/START domain
MTFDPVLDLRLELRVACSPDHLWRGYTDPALLMQWFCPRPWRVTSCDLDLRPGGAFRTVMEGPAGEREDNAGCFLELVPGRRVVWTNALEPGFRPAPDTGDGVGFVFTAIVEFEPAPEGALYRATVCHRTPADRERHAAMGFTEGWSAALAQLVALG